MLELSARTIKNNAQVVHGCELEAVIEFHMPYKTNTHVSSSTKFAIGNEVAVNAIIGMSFIKAAQLKIDLVDDVVESNLLIMDPIKIVYKRPTKHMPNNIDGTNMETATLLSDRDSVMKNHIQSYITFLADNEQKANNAMTTSDDKSLREEDSSRNE